MSLAGRLNCLWCDGTSGASLKARVEISPRPEEKRKKGDQHSGPNSSKPITARKAGLAPKLTRGWSLLRCCHKGKTIALCVGFPAVLFHRVPNKNRSAVPDKILTTVTGSGRRPIYYVTVPEHDGGIRTRDRCVFEKQRNRWCCV
ncbi:hypothetical protein Bbelb_368970 [Branchiostoma belcheri]|nr:hypothetical protein Bbelb_368970 [Branchiostoma belcheri]